MYHKVCRENIRRLKHKCKVNDYLIRSMSSLYDGSKARVCNVPWVFKIFFDRVVRLVNERTTGRGVKLDSYSGLTKKK